MPISDMGEDAFRLLAKRAKLDEATDNELPLLINEEWGSDVLFKAYKDRLTGAVRLSPFSYLRDHKVIIVAGPVGSGVTDIAERIHKELGHELVLDSFSLDTFKSSVKIAVDSGEKFVYAVTKYVADIHELDPVALIAFVIGSIEDTEESQRDSEWGGEEALIDSYPEFIRRSPSALMVYDYWYGVQKPKIQNTYEIVYGELMNLRLRKD